VCLGLGIRSVEAIKPLSGVMPHFKGFGLQLLPTLNVSSHHRINFNLAVNALLLQFSGRRCRFHYFITFLISLICLKA
jgi:hypothetical protein